MGRGTKRVRVGVEVMNLRSPAQSSKTRSKCGGGAAKKKKTEAEFAPMIGGNHIACFVNGLIVSGDLSGYPGEGVAEVPC